MHREETSNSVVLTSLSFSEKDESILLSTTLESDSEMSGHVVSNNKERSLSPTPPEPETTFLLNETLRELWNSTDYIFQSRLTWLLIFGPIALVGSSNGILGDAACFCFSGIAIIPCAERLSFITEQVAEHTNGTIGALLNATFGNAPELLISVAALRSGFYRVVQLAMLGSMITNMLFVFGMSCIIGGIRWQVQDIRLVSGNVSVIMLLVSTAGSLIPATLILSGQFEHNHNHHRNLSADLDSYVPSKEEVTLSRVNAAVMFILYMCYLIFQLSTHKREFDVDRRIIAKPNRFCRKFCKSFNFFRKSQSDSADQQPMRGRIKKRRSDDFLVNMSTQHRSPFDSDSVTDFDIEELEEEGLLDSFTNSASAADAMALSPESASGGRRRRTPRRPLARSQSTRHVQHANYALKPQQSSLEDTDDEDWRIKGAGDHQAPVMSMRVGIIWLFIITMCISAMSDILVGTIDGFASRAKLSQVFTSMVIIPFFSNVAEQVSAFIFAYRNEMDLCVGVTIGSAIQIATFVLPGSVLIGIFLDRSMTLYFHGYETVCLMLCTVIVAAVLQSGSTNWMVGATLVGIYIMFSAGIWYHEVENLSVDEEEMFSITNHTRV